MGFKPAARTPAADIRCLAGEFVAAVVARWKDHRVRFPARGHVGHLSEAGRWRWRQKRLLLQDQSADRAQGIVVARRQGYRVLAARQRAPVFCGHCQLEGGAEATAIPELQVRRIARTGVTKREMDFIQLQRDWAGQRFMSGLSRPDQDSGEFNQRRGVFAMASRWEGALLPHVSQPWQADGDRRLRPMLVGISSMAPRRNSSIRNMKITITQTVETGTPTSSRAMVSGSSSRVHLKRRRSRRARSFNVVLNWPLLLTK